MRNLELVRCDLDGTPHPVQRVVYEPGHYGFIVTLLNHTKLHIGLLSAVPELDTSKPYEPNEAHYFAAEDIALKIGQKYFWDYRKGKLGKPVANQGCDYEVANRDSDSGQQRIC